MKPDRCVLLGFGVIVEAGSWSSLIARVANWSLRVARRGKVARSKTSPERRIGTVLEYFSVRISRASVKMGVVEGVLRVRGWMVSQSTLRAWAWPTTVSMKSIVFLGKGMNY